MNFLRYHITILSFNRSLDQYFPDEGVITIFAILNLPLWYVEKQGGWVKLLNDVDSKIVFEWQRLNHI